MPAPTGASFTRWSGSTRGASLLTTETSKTHSCSTRLCLRGCVKSKYRGGPGQAEGRVLEHPVDDLVLALPHSRPLALEQLVSRAPGQHQERDDARQQQR